MHIRVGTGVALLLLCCSIGVAQSSNNPISTAGPTIASSELRDSGRGPLVNTSAANARTIIPDGTSYSDNFADGANQWFTARVENGKSYVVEAIDPYDDLGANAIDLAIFESDGTTPMTNAQVYCSTTIDRTAALAAPSLEVSDDGDRCIVRPFVGSAFPPKNITIRVTQSVGTVFQVRMRESTIYSRWTVNGYDMHVELQNNSAEEADAQVCLYGDAGGGDPVQVCSSFQIPGHGSTKIVYPHNGINPNRGGLRVGAAASTTAVFVPGQVNLQTYAYNTGPGTYLFFTPQRANDGSTANSW
jgi:hypothetical protein